MPTTSNFGWTTPADTDLVKDGAAAIRTLGNGIDTSLVDLKGGTTGQYLVKQSNTDLDFTWTTNTADIDGITATSPLTGGGTSGTITVGIQDGTTAQKGAVQLTDSISSTSTTTAATPNSVKTAYDLANGAIAKSLVDAKADLITATADNTPARLAVGNDGETLVADSSATTGLRWQSAYNGNGVINGALDFWQRGTSFTTNGYAADRWYFFPAGVAGRTCTRQSSGLTGFNYCARVARDSGNTATTSIGFLQSFATEEALRFAGQTATLSFYARAGANYSPTSSVLTPYIISGTGTDQNRAGANYTGESIVSSSTVTLTTSWQKFTKTVTFASTVTEFAIYFEATPTGTAGAADYFEVTGVQLELGSVATTFKRSMNTLAGELLAAQRYYFRTTVGSGASVGPIGNAYSTTGIVFRYRLPATMRVTPTSIDYNTLKVGDDVNAQINLTSLTLDGNSTPDLGQVIAAVSSGLTQYRSYAMNGQGAGSYLGFNAEL